MRTRPASTGAALIAVLMVLLGLASCSRGPELTGNLLIWVDEARADSIGALAQDWGREHGVEVSVATVSFDDMEAQFPAAANEPSGPDIILGANDWAGTWTQQGLLAPIDLGDHTSDFNQSAVEAFTIDGNVYGVPVAVENVVLFRNTDLAPQAPASIDEMAQVGLARKSEGKADFPIGISIGESGDAYSSYPLLSSTGGYFFAGPDEQGAYDVTDVGLASAGGLEFARGWASLAAQGAIASSFTEDGIKEGWQQGRVPYWITGPWNSAVVTDSRVPFVAEPVPGWLGATGKAVPIVSVQGFMVNEASQNPAAATEFLRSTMTTDAMNSIFEADRRPPAWLASAEQQRDDPIVGAVLAAGEGGFPNLPYPEMGIVYQEAGVEQKRIADGGDPSTEAEAAQQRVQAAIAAQ